MNILILFSQPWRVGGAETHVRALIAGLQANQHRIFLAVNRGSDPRQTASLTAEFPRLRVLTIQARGANVLAWLTSLKKLAALMKAEQIDVVSAQQRTAGLWAWLLSKRTGVPFTVTMHDAWHRVIAPRRYAGLFPRMVVVSRNLEERLVKDFGFSPSAITLIQNGIDFQKFTARDAQKAKESLGLPPDRPLFLHVSRLSSIKGAVALVLLESMDLILRSFPKAQVVVIGEGPLRGSVEEKANGINAKWGPVVSVRDFTDDIVTWYNAADLVIGEGRVAIETLACCTPVVAIRNGQNFFGAVTPDNLTEAMAVNFDGRNWPATPEHLAREIAMALALPDESRRQIAGKLKEQMSLETMSRKYIQLFQKIVGEHR